MFTYSSATQLREALLCAKQMLDSVHAGGPVDYCPCQGCWFIRKALADTAAHESGTGAGEEA